MIGLPRSAWSTVGESIKFIDRAMMRNSLNYAPVCQSQINLKLLNYCNYVP